MESSITFMRSALLVILLFLFGLSDVIGQENTIKGKIIDKETNEELIGASVVIKGTTIGSVTDIDGNFEFKTNQSPPFVIVISFIGYISFEQTIGNFDEPISVKLGADHVMMDEVQIVGSRISEKQKMAALTTESMDVLAIKEAASGDFYESLGNLKGVDVTSASMGFKVINTRGFNSTSPVRSLQLIDGVDNQSPGLNFSLGNFLGSPDLDVMNVEIVAGASSAFFGPGAFNGVINMTSKSPWLFPGLSAELKVGERNLTQVSVRWAQIIKNKEGKEKFAYKLNILGMQANDWEAGNLDASTTSDDPPSNFAGYDAVNRYGDEVLTGGNDFSNNPITFPGLGRIYRTGYMEKDIVDYDTQNAKANIGLYYMITDKIEINYGFNYSFGTTVYQGDNRYSMKNIQFMQNKLQISQADKFFVRAYITNEDAGDTYDAVVTAFEMSEASKAEGVFYKDYSSYYQTNIIPRMYDAGLPTNEDN
ncbi:MAG: TonB-dependent receptor, partial [Bacteroidetes bacterium]